MKCTPMLEQIHSLPDLVRQCLPIFWDKARTALSDELCSTIDCFFLTGCGDSHHAAVASELAFGDFAGVRAMALTSLAFSRYTVPFVAHPGRAAVIGVSASGEVARTIEGLQMAKKRGMTAIAVTGVPTSRMASSADLTLDAAIPPLATAVATPGVRSYIASLLMVCLAAMRVGEARGSLGQGEAVCAYRELEQLPEWMASTLSANETVVKHVAERWSDATEFVFVGAGPNYGTALFSAAKVLEASGDTAVGQDCEEWTHLQYFARTETTPTFFIDAGGRSHSRTSEAAVAARTIGRRVAAVVPEGELEITSQAEVALAVSGWMREAFSPLLCCLPGMLFADYRAGIMGESYFRGFSGGRSAEGGGGISRIRTSDILGDVEP